MKVQLGDVVMAKSRSQSWVICPMKMVWGWPIEAYASQDQDVWPIQCTSFRKR